VAGERYFEGRSLAGGELKVEFQVLDPHWLVRHILQYGADAEVVEPSAIRALMRRVLGVGKLFVPSGRGPQPGEMAVEWTIVLLFGVHLSRGRRRDRWARGCLIPCLPNRGKDAARGGSPVAVKRPHVLRR